MKKIELPITDHLSNIQKNYSPLHAAYKIQQYAADQGFDWANANQVLANIASEVIEVAAEINPAIPDQRKVLDEYSDLLYGVINLARHLNIEVEQALTYACEKFITRFAKVEEQVIQSGSPMQTINIDELMQYWVNAKIMLKEASEN